MIKSYRSVGPSPALLPRGERGEREGEHPRVKIKSRAAGAPLKRFAITQLYFSDPDVLDRPLQFEGVVEKLAKGVIADALRAGVTHAVPFILTNDGVYDCDLNRFFRACPTMGVRSRNSLRAYGRDIVTWMRFLAHQRQGKSIWRANRDDMAAYHAARRRSAPCSRISAATWNRSIAALEKFYSWALEEELVTASPFLHGVAWRQVSRGGHFVAMRVNRGYEPGARRHDMRFIDLERYLAFRDVGLRGGLPGGIEAPVWRGRHSERNVLFAELLVTTGLRLEEASSLLVAELPRLEGIDRAKRSLAFRVPAAIAKGNKPREIRLPLRLLRRLHDYVEVERANALGRAADGHHLDPRRAPIAIVEHGRGTIVIVTGGEKERVRLDLLAPDDRHRLVEQATGAPAMLWLAENGRPMTPAAWAAVFRRASARCRMLDVELDVTPHALRHYLPRPTMSGSGTMAHDSKGL